MASGPTWLVGTLEGRQVTDYTCITLALYIASFEYLATVVQFLVRWLVWRLYPRCVSILEGGAMA